MIDLAELPKGIERLDQGGGTLPSGFGSTYNQQEGIHENAFEINIASDSLKTRNFSNPFSYCKFLINKSSSLGARTRWGKNSIN